MNELSRSWVTYTSLFFYPNLFFFEFLKERVHLHLHHLLIFVLTFCWCYFFFVYRLEMKSSSFYPDFDFFQTTPWLQIIFIFRSLCIFASFVIFFVLVLFWNFFCEMNELSRSWVTSTFFFIQICFFFSAFLRKQFIFIFFQVVIFVPTLDVI